ncbi:hypothetical protein EMIHUDRAFT_248441 [Emiliania huxleyi CCMP1516]|uniref:CUB domain-containing protein n=2 Tax=Emiliania huxleyi TaxID=2903 RepID=A0A0D3IGF3_EMIH1|nr:hypothetical protein EMIHUDRAFT_248441 [Emiliania huxleyi CCMP1516]EOD10338.1 hypothetical protein EMIHUDRAFT_248441 [Emiliania huxleyi CCMP1516]|eukprot:XP_005762767.1 hypothetical protein EMIHUDRAFT_248441 [Emiliania huxleyi CCMP1516]
MAPIYDFPRAARAEHGHGAKKQTPLELLCFIEDFARTAHLRSWSLHEIMYITKSPQGARTGSYDRDPAAADPAADGAGAQAPATVGPPGMRRALASAAGAAIVGDGSLADSTVNSLGVTCGGGGAPVWCAEPPQQPLAELCVSEDPIEASGSTSNETVCTTATAHSKSEADETGTKLNIGDYAELAPFDETFGATKIGSRVVKPSLEESFTNATALSEVDVASLLFLNPCAAVLALLLAAFLEPLLRGQVKKKSVEGRSHAAISVPLLSSKRALRVGIVILFFLQGVWGTPAAPPVNVSSPCSLTDGGWCAASPNYPNSYGNSEECTISGVPPVGLETVAFDVEAYGCRYDYLTVNGTKYCGTSGPSGAVAEDGVIEWRSDGSVVGSGWKDQLRNLIEDATSTPADVSVYLPPSAHFKLSRQISCTSTIKVTVASSGEGATLDGQGETGLFYLSGGCSLALRGLTLVNGRVGSGGVVNANGAGDVEIIESVVRDCSATYFGGVVYAQDSGAVSIISSTVAGCSAGTWGGVVWAVDSESLSVAGVDFIDNRADGSGSVLYLQGLKQRPSISNASFSGNDGLL